MNINQAFQVLNKYMIVCSCSGDCDDCIEIKEARAVINDTLESTIKCPTCGETQQRTVVIARVHREYYHINGLHANYSSTQKSEFRTVDIDCNMCGITETNVDLKKLGILLNKL